VPPTPREASKPASASPETEDTDTPPPASKPPDRLIIPAIELDSSIVPVSWYSVEEGGSQYSVWEVADRVVGWHKTAALPGNVGNIVLSGHHNIQGQIFRYLVDLEPGDHVLVYVEDQAYYYAVTEKMILKEKGEPAQVRQQNATWIGPTKDERLTMVTCWPYTNNTHRLVVIAKPIAPPKSDGLEE
jgi:sortase A